jgi:riboflavin kinase / FMN adenylyltransferase
MPIAVVHNTAEWLATFGGRARRTVLTVGNFDGVHRGHQEILRKVRERAAVSGDVSAVLTFYPHPAQVLRPAQAPSLLMTLPQRLAAIEQMGIAAAFVLRFDTELAKVSAEDFVREFLVETMNARGVLVGGNFRFGHRQTGDVALLTELGTRWNFEVVIEPPVVENGAVISSTLIRTTIREGCVEDANRLLGRPFTLAGEIRTGTGQGRKLIVPTLNLATENELLPANGVYATQVLVGGKVYDAATNVGVRPTFDGTSVTVESHLLNFAENLTSGKMQVQFRARLRDERKFPGVDALRAEVLHDIERAREYFRESNAPAV